MKQPAIFASYRREDDPHLVGRVVGDLRACFGGPAVFYDVEDIRPGQPWPARLREALSNCSILLAFIGSGWHKSWHDEVGPRLWDKNDWVRNEISFAISAKGKVVIPVLTTGTKMPHPKALPQDCSLKKIYIYNSVSIDSSYYGSDIERLALRIGEILNQQMQVSAWIESRKIMAETWRADPMGGRRKSR